MSKSQPTSVGSRTQTPAPAGVDGRGLVDVHQHVIPPSWRDLAARGTDAVGWALPAWDPASARAFRRERGIGAAVLSNNISSAITDHPDQVDLVRRSNDYCAELVADSPGELGFFACLPLPGTGRGLDEVLIELDRALGDLSAAGVVLPTSVAGTYLGDARFDPLWAELDRRNAVVFLHPDEPTFPALPGVPAVLVDFVLETLRCAVHLVARGVLHRHRRVRIILSHGAGGLASVAHRVAFGLPMVRPEKTGDEWLEDFRRFHVETALASTEPALASLTAFLPEGHLHYGTDYPYAPAPVVDRFRALLDGAPIDDRTRSAVYGRGALDLFPGLVPDLRS